MFMFNNNIKLSIVMCARQEVFSLVPAMCLRGEAKENNAYCLRMRLIKSPFCDDDVLVSVGFCS